MSSTNSVVTADPLLKRMKLSRKSSAVLKIELALLRQKYPDGAIFAFEGVEDKTVYLRWIRKITPRLRFEPFLCSGKTYVLSLRSMLLRDLTDLGNNVFFFVDHDFDGLRDHPDGQDIFVTDCYSVENYLVTSTVVEETLLDEIHFHGAPETRKYMVTIFESVYSEFLAITRDLNFRLFCAKRLRIPIEGSLPDKAHKIAAISIDKAIPSNPPPEECINLAQSLSASQLEEMRGEFDRLHPPDSYRGKFAVMFLLHWIRQVSEARVERSFGPVKQMEQIKKTNVSQVSLASLAEKSLYPKGLEEFLGNIQRSLAA